MCCLCISTGQFCEDSSLYPQHELIRELCLTAVHNDGPLHIAKSCCSNYARGGTGKGVEWMRSYILCLGGALDLPRNLSGAAL